MTTPGKERRPGPKGAAGIGGAATGGAAISSDFAETLAGLEIPLPSVMPGASNAAAQEDPLVYIGGNGETRRLSVMNQSFYGLSAQQLIEFQMELARAGRIKRVTGEHDEETFDFWQAVNERAANFFKSGVKRTPAEILSSLAPVADDDEEERFAGNVSQVTDSLTLETQVQQAARSRLGRKLKRSEAARFVAVYQGLQRQSNTSMNTAAQAAQPTPGADGQDSEIFSPPSGDVAADQFIDNGFAQEAAGQDAYGYLNALRQMIGGD